jgi:hypothetical protein
LPFGEITEIGFEFVEEVTPGHSVIIVLLECFVDPTDHRQAQNSSAIITASSMLWVTIKMAPLCIAM